MIILDLFLFSIEFSIGFSIEFSIYFSIQFSPRYPASADAGRSRRGSVLPASRSAQRGAAAVVRRCHCDLGSDPRLAAGRTCCRFDRIDFAAFLTTSRTNASDASDGGLAEKERIVQVYHLIILFVCENSTLKLVRDDETHGKQSFSRPRTWPGPI